LTGIDHRSFRRAAVCAVALVALAGFGPSPGAAVAAQVLQAPAAPGKAPASRLSAAELAFASDLYRELATTRGNVVFSPSSISSVLTILLLGAKGSTAAQLQAALHLDGLGDSAIEAAATAQRLQLAPLASDPQEQVLSSDDLWPQQGAAISSAFLAAVKSGWAAEVRALDFDDPSRAADTIDAAVSTATRGLIPRLLTAQELTPPVELVVTDAVYLHAAWATPFDPAQTSPAPFFGATTEQVPTMHETALLRYARRSGYQVIELPYAGGRLEMTILLPDGALAPLEARLESEGLTALTGGVQPTQITLLLPRFTVSYQATLNDDLRALGITAAFEPSTADFSGIDANHAYLSALVHQAIVKVAEKGTVAAAATGAVVAPSAVEESRLTVAVDRPFLFAITDTATGTPFFLGRVETPGGS
jgi:serpin B